MSPSVNNNFGSTQNNNQGGTQYNYNIDRGNVTVNNTSTPESVLEKLTPHIATNALHNAKARANRDACLEGTRGGFIEELGEWVKGHRGNGHVLWVKAGAGVGKTAVAQTLCEKYCRTENSAGLLAAAHFFSRNDTSRNTMNRFIATIAYQLARLHLYLADAIDAAIRSDPGIMGADWEDQFQRLICEPCKQIDPELWKTLPTLVIIDGLDECMDIDEPQTMSQRRNVWKRDGQSRLLSMIRKSLTATPPLPLRFLIFSRPEHTISNLLHTDSFPNLKETDMRELRAEADDDIYLYLCQEFARLVKVRRDAGLDVSWPGEKAIQQLTRMSDGHFIYVVTAVKYVMDEDPSSTPQERLDIILCPKPSKYPDLHPIDTLYHHILQPFVDIREQLLLPLLRLIITPPAEYPLASKYLRNPKGTEYRSRRILAELLSQPNCQHISIILSRLRSVLYIPYNECSEAVSVLHASFSDFLRDQRRSHDFHVELMDNEHYLKKSCQSSLHVLKCIMLRYGNNQEGIGPREPPMIEAWAFSAWDTLVGGIGNYHRTFRFSELGAEFLHAVDEFDVYCYVNALNDRNYMRPLTSIPNGGWNEFIVEEVLSLSQVYAFLTRPDSGGETWYLDNIEYLRLARSKSRHRNQPFFRFFKEDWMAVLPKQDWEVCYLQLKLLIGCLWDPLGSFMNPTSYCGSVLPFHDGDNSGKGNFLKIFPHDIPPSTLAQSMAIEDCQFWRFGVGPWGAFKFRQVMIAPTANGDPGWITVPSASSDLHEWMVNFAREQMKRAMEIRERKWRRAMKKQEAVKQPARQAAVLLRRLLNLDPELEEECQVEVVVGQEEEEDWEEENWEAGEEDWEMEEREWEDFVYERQYQGPQCELEALAQAGSSLWPLQVVCQSVYKILQHEIAVDLAAILLAKEKDHAQATFFEMLLSHTMDAASLDSNDK
ncbi:hypothetical protein V5O48_010820 [Marasmius crinis-equi]|uniref:Nephrocystin 3-like N-terminal domain-containing protein n=1 Tax=Marasmius crinis-equi TaxID=585013 RepID=A0ABR3F7L9_9AGAR